MHRRKTVFKIKNEEKIWTFAVLDLILLNNTRSFRSEKCTKTLSVVFPIATLLSVSSCIAEVPHRHPWKGFQVNFFLFDMVSQVITKSSFLHARYHLMLHLQTHTHCSVSLCFTEFTAQNVRPVLLHTSMFDVSFSVPSQKEGLWQWVISKIQSHCVHSSTLRTQTTTSACSYWVLSIIFEVLQCSNITETLQRC